MNNANNTVELAAPWTIYAKQVTELFAADKDITVIYEDDNPYELKIFVESMDKYTALVSLMPGEKTFGNVTLEIRIFPSNTEKSDSERFDILFKNNPVFSKVVKRSMPGGGETDFVMFAPDVAQYYGDNAFDDPYGNITQLYADVAKDVFGEKDGVKYSTDVKCREWML